MFNFGAGMMAGLSLARLEAGWPMLIASLHVVVGIWLVALSMKRIGRKATGPFGCRANIAHPLQRPREKP
jgi:hypothetical protein